MIVALKRAGAGLALLLMLVTAALASMVRVIPAGQPGAPVSVPETRLAEPHELPATTSSVEPLPQAPAMIVPVQGIGRNQLVDTWGQSRAGGARTHTAIDIMAPGGTPVIAAAPGMVEKLYYSNGGGGITLYERSSDRLWTYYYAHLQGYAPGVTEGMPVAQGQLLGFVGDTGNAGTGNYHLHFGVSQMQPGERWWQGVPINPYPLLAGKGSGS